MPNNRDLVKLGITITFGLIAAGTIIYSLANVHAEVRANTKELTLRRDYVYSVPLMNERLAKIPGIEEDISAIKLSVARIEARLRAPERPR